MGLIHDDGNSAATVTSKATVMSAKTLRKRRIASIFQHYYPEGGWGYVILLCGLLVQVFAHGLQLSYGMLFPIVTKMFRVRDDTDAGRNPPPSSFIFYGLVFFCLFIRVRRKFTPPQEERNL